MTQVIQGYKIRNKITGKYLTKRYAEAKTGYVWATIAQVENAVRALQYSIDNANSYSRRDDVVTPEVKDYEILRLVEMVDNDMSVEQVSENIKQRDLIEKIYGAQTRMVIESAYEKIGKDHGLSFLVKIKEDYNRHNVYPSYESAIQFLKAEKQIRNKHFVVRREGGTSVFLLKDKDTLFKMRLSVTGNITYHDISSGEEFILTDGLKSAK